MGAWGEGIEESDTVLDVIEMFVEGLRSSQSAAAATAKVRQDLVHVFSEGNADPDAVTYVRIGLALAQWR